jgi:hypothetical protein
VPVLGPVGNSHRHLPTGSQPSIPVSGSADRALFNSIIGGTDREEVSRRLRCCRRGSQRAASRRPASARSAARRSARPRQSRGGALRGGVQEFRHHRGGAVERVLRLAVREEPVDPCAYAGARRVSSTEIHGSSPSPSETRPPRDRRRPQTGPLIRSGSARRA